MGGERSRARGWGGERERAGLRRRWGFEGSGVRERPELAPRGASRRAVGGAGRGGRAQDRGRSRLVSRSDAAGKFSHHAARQHASVRCYRYASFGNCCTVRRYRTAPMLPMLGFERRWRFDILTAWTPASFDLCGWCGGWPSSLDNRTVFLQRSLAPWCPAPWFIDRENRCGPQRGAEHADTHGQLEVNAAEVRTAVSHGLLGQFTYSEDLFQARESEDTQGPDELGQYPPVLDQAPMCAHRNNESGDDGQ
jgi:hypothetical protein